MVDRPPRKAWRLLPRASPQELATLGDLPSPLPQLLHNRDIRTRAEAEAFLTCDDALFGDPFLLPDMARAVERVHRAVQAGETVALFGDFDVDGVSGTALLARALSTLGLRVVPYIPHRVKEGHGLNLAALQLLRQQGATLLITVDCGVSSVTEVEKAAGLGMETVITDHHTCPALLPPAVAIVNPRAPGSRYPFPHLAGAGLALKLAQALLLPEKGPQEWHHGLMGLATLGTIADVVPLLGENRYIVSHGLRSLSTLGNPGLRALCRLVGLPPGAIDTEAVGWVIGPRLNAAGRMDHAAASYELLTTDDPAEADRLAATLEELNGRRKAMTEEALAEAQQQLADQAELGPLLMVGAESFSPGVIGLVAGRLVEGFHRPTFALAIGAEVTTGSGRSIPQFNLAEALNDCADLFLRFGGHPQAAGFTVATPRLAEVRRRLVALASQRLAGLVLQPSITIDAEVALGDLAGETYRNLQRLAPFGAANPPPTFLTRGVEVVAARLLGARGQHTRLKLRQGRAVWEAMAFDQPWTHGTRRADLVYSVGVDRWNGEEVLGLVVMDWRPA
ncbi:MAG: single-stranded-DNA-specific exonuclease RecJ [Chloroflexi bacterium]|nr:single-stranded-DNA-specific exonuclease RecJ [Chloroflexota bacterium]